MYVYSVHVPFIVFTFKLFKGVYGWINGSPEVHAVFVTLSLKTRIVLNPEHDKRFHNTEDVCMSGPYRTM